MMDVLRERCDEYASASLLRTPVIDAVDASEGSLFKGAGHADDNDGRLGHRQVGFFQVQGVDTGGQVVVRRQLKRRYTLPFFQKPWPCLVGVEACGSAHYWSRELEALAHTVRLMPQRMRRNSICSLCKWCLRYVTLFSFHVRRIFGETA
jgi:hypothetical protein